MIDFLKFLKPKLKYLLGISLISAMLSQFLLPVATTRADGPQFNFLQGDRELFLGRNDTMKEIQYHDPVTGIDHDPETGTTGNIFTGSVYYHNGVEGSITENTHVQVTIPLTTVNAGARLTATVSASNADSVSDTLDLNLDRDADIALIPGSVQWFPEVETKGTAVPTPLPNLPDGTPQSGNELISSNGLYIGDIQGCWPYAGYVHFQFRSIPKAAPQPSLTMQKTVRNVTKGEGNFAENTSAIFNDIVEFNVDVANNGSMAIDNIIVRDQLPAELSPEVSIMNGLNRYVDSDSFSYSTTELDQFLATGINLGHPLAPGQTEHIQFQAKVNTNVAAIKTVINTAYVSAGAINLSDTATVTLKPTGAVIERHKKATNVTTGKSTEAGTIDGQSVLTVGARQGDEIVYALTTKNAGDVTSVIKIEDEITDILRQADLISASDNGNLRTEGESKFISYPDTTINPGESVDRTFTVRIHNPLAPFGGNIDDKLVNVYGETVVVTLTRPTPLAPKVHIEKLVRNFTVNESNFVKANTAYAGDTLEYRINFWNDGTGPSDEVKLSDVLPPNTQYITGTTVISRNGKQEQTLLDGITSGGIKIDQIAAGENSYIRFKVVTSNKIAAGEVLTNTAYLAHRGETLSDIAKTTIKAAPAPVQVVQPEIPLPKLPKTGGAASMSFVITFMASLAFMYTKYRKEIIARLEVVKLASDIASL